MIGTGTAKIYLAKVHEDSALVSDPQLVIFNAGVAKGGLAKMKIYAYSRTTNVGILMHGTVSKGIINVFIPVLSNDSATSSFIPGPARPWTSMFTSTVSTRTTFGAKCASGPLGQPEPPPRASVPTERHPDRPLDHRHLAADHPGLRQRPPRRSTRSTVRASRTAETGSYKVTIRTRALPPSRMLLLPATAAAFTSQTSPQQDKTVSVKAKIRRQEGCRQVHWPRPATSMSSTTKQVKVEEDCLNQQRKKGRPAGLVPTRSPPAR